MWVRVALLSLALAIGLGAFGAHGLTDLVSESRLETWETAVRYQVWMSLALLALNAGRFAVVPGALWTMAAGMLIFSGSLYTLVALDLGLLGAITPIGGLLMIAGLVWAALGYRATTAHR